MPKKAAVKNDQKTVQAVQDIQNVQNKFTKEQILASKKYCNRRDLIEALLNKNESYTIEAVDKLINDFMKGKVK